MPSGILFNLDATKNITYNVSNNVTSWTDPNNNVTTSTGSGSAPTYYSSIINGKPAMYFGSGQILTTSSLTPSTTTTLTVFTVVYSTSYYSGYKHFFTTHGLWQTGSIHDFTANFCVYNANYNTGFTLQNNNPYIITINYTSSTTFTVRLNGVQSINNTTSANPYYNISQIDIGNWDQDKGGRPFNGYIGQMLLFKNSLSSADMSNIESSLSNKWQIPIGSTPVISSTNVLGL